jgi:hypothetical protein
MASFAEIKRARAVWREAKVPKRGPLGVVAALALAHDLEWAARWREVASSTLPPRERVRQKRIEAAAVNLAKLSANRCTVSELNALHSIGDSAWAAQRHRGAAAVLCEIFGSPERLFITRLASAYFKNTGRKAVYGRDNYCRRISGPFVRFVQETSRQFCPGMTVPHWNTIRLAVDTLLRHAEK